MALKDRKVRVATLSAGRWCCPETDLFSTLMATVGEERVAVRAAIVYALLHEETVHYFRVPFPIVACLIACACTNA